MVSASNMMREPAMRPSGSRNGPPRRTLPPCAAIWARWASRVAIRSSRLSGLSIQLITNKGISGLAPQGPRQEAVDGFVDAGLPGKDGGDGGGDRRVDAEALGELAHHRG